MWKNSFLLFSVKSQPKLKIVDIAVLHMDIARSLFKTFNQVQDQGGSRWATTVIAGLFRGLTTLIQRRDWA
jgi:hypothetical protein